MVAGAEGESDGGGRSRGAGGWSKRRRMGGRWPSESGEGVAVAWESRERAAAVAGAEGGS